MQPRCNTLLKWNHHWSFTRCGSPNTVTSSHRWTLPKFTHIRQNHTHTRHVGDVVAPDPLAQGSRVGPCFSRPWPWMMSWVPFQWERKLIFPNCLWMGYVPRRVLQVWLNHIISVILQDSKKWYIYIYICIYTAHAFPKHVRRPCCLPKKGIIWHNHSIHMLHHVYASTPAKKKLHSLITNNLKLRWLGFQTRAAWDFPYLFRGAWEGKGWASFTRSCLVNKNPSTFSPLGFGPHIW